MADNPYQAQADAAADKFGVPRALYSALIFVESAWNPYIPGKDGEVGLSQVKPATAADMGYPNLHIGEVDKGLEAGAKYLRTQFDRFGNWGQALAAYNAGPGNINAGKPYAEKVVTLANTYDPSWAGTSAEEKSIADEAWEWIKDKLGKTGPEIFGTPDLGAAVQEKFGTGARYAAAGVFVLALLIVGVIVVSLRGKDAALSTGEKVLT